MINNATIIISAFTILVVFRIHRFIKESTKEFILTKVKAIHYEQAYRTAEERFYRSVDEGMEIMTADRQFGYDLKKIKDEQERLETLNTSQLKEEYKVRLEMREYFNGY